MALVAALGGIVASASASMPACDVASVQPVSGLLEPLAGHALLSSHKQVDSSTACAQMCEDNERCEKFVLDILAEEPVCALYSSAAGVKTNVVKANSPHSIIVGTCRNKLEDDMPLLLGLDYFEKGIDAINDTINRTQHIRLPIYNYHYVEQKSYFDPFSAVAFKVPDEVSMTVNEAGYEQIDSLYSDVFSESVSETTKRYSWSVGVQLNFGQVAAGVQYSDNKQWYNFDLEEKERMNYNSHSIMWWKFYEVQAYPMEVLGGNALDPIFKSYLDQLPKTISGPNDTKKYDTLLENWGTHYITWANFGGSLDLDIFTNGSFDRSQTQEWKSDQHSLTFHFTLYDIDPSASIAGFTNKSQIHINQSFTNASRVRLFYEGGDPTLMGDDSLVPWKNSIRKAPHWLNVTYQPLSKLPNLDAQTAKTLETYIMQYLKKVTG